MRFLPKLIIFLFNISLISADLIEPPEFYSQFSQDHFVYKVLYELSGKQDEGCYLEIGAGDPQFFNNTYFFEKNLNWKGVSIDIIAVSEIGWDYIRTNPLLIQDARCLNYSSLLKEFPHVIDYLSLDIDDDYDTVLKRIPFNEHTFKVITIEHDFYRLGEKYRDAEREILSSLGYTLLCPDVREEMDNIFEDWWIHPDAFPAGALSILTSLDLKQKRHNEIMLILQSAFE